MQAVNTRIKVIAGVLLVISGILFGQYSEFGIDPVRALISRFPASSSAQILLTDDGNARVVFTPISRSDQVEVFDIKGNPLASINWSGAFEVSVPEQSIRESTTDKGIDIHKLLERVGTVRSSTGAQLVTAALPMSVTGHDGKEIPAGSTVYFGLERLAKEGVMAPVGAWGGNSMGPGGAVNQFNDRLLDRGVRGARPAKGSAGTSPANGHSHGGVHGEGRIPKDANVVEGQSQDTRSTNFLSSPTCVHHAQDSLRTTSEFGRRRSFRTNNGAYATRMHEGLDVAGKVGTPIVAAAAGCIKIRDMRFNRNVGWGISLQIDHGNGITTQYSHMHGLTPELREFVRSARSDDLYCVKRGEAIGSIGQTGNCTGPHLHFGVRENGKSVDPRKHLRAKANGDFAMQCRDLQAEAEQLSDLDRIAQEFIGSRDASNPKSAPVAR